MFIFHIAICSLGVGLKHLGLGLGLVLGHATAGLDYKTVFNQQTVKTSANVTKCPHNMEAFVMKAKKWQLANLSKKQHNREITMVCLFIAFYYSSQNKFI